MTVEISIKNLGALKQAKFTLGDLTIICGCNNTGKTYATYALFGFLYDWREMFSVEIDSSKVDQLLLDGVIRLDMQEYAKKSEQIIDMGCQAYTKKLPDFFAASSDRFKETEFKVKLDIQNLHLGNSYVRQISAAKTDIFLITKAEESTDLVVTLLSEKEKIEIPRDVLRDIISEALKDALFAQLIPKPFIASAERTGAAIFRKELNFARNRLLDEMSQTGKNINPIELLFKVHQDYPLPVEKDVDFARQLENIVKNTSFIAEEYPGVLEDFADIIGGEYNVTRNDGLYYIPTGKRVKLAMDESSSAVRSLLVIGFYLRHKAQRGDILMVDEPELNLHPENQRRVARLFARLINLGIKVFITTHSDYIVKELNTLIMLNHDKPYLKKIAEDEGYRQEDLISSERIKVYIAEEALVVLDGKTRKTRCQTLTLAEIHPEFGIEARSFDTTIEEMNRIQESIIWGKE